MEIPFNADVAHWFSVEATLWKSAQSGLQHELSTWSDRAEEAFKELFAERGGTAEERGRRCRLGRLSSRTKQRSVSTLIERQIQNPGRM